MPTKDKKRKRQTIVNKGQTETKTNNSQQRTKREKDKQWSTKDKKRKRQTMFNTKVDRKQLMIEQQQPTKIRGSSQVP